MTYLEPSNITNIGEILPYINTVMDNMFGTALLFVLFFIFWISMKEYRTDRAFAAAAFISMPIAIFLFIMGLINTYILIIFVILTIVGYLSIKQ